MGKLALVQALGSSLSCPKGPGYEQKPAGELQVADEKSLHTQHSQRLHAGRSWPSWGPADSPVGFLCLASATSARA